MNGKAVIKLLEKDGWVHISTHGSHFKLKKPGYLPIIVPVHGKNDLKIGTLHSIEKIAGIKLR